MQSSLPNAEIIVIDDIPLVVKTTLRFLRKQSYEPLGFVDPKEALEYLKTPNQVKVAIIDLTMPIMDGFEVAKRIKAMDLGIFCIAASASVNDYHTESELEGFDHIVDKPLHGEAITSIIDSCLNQKALNSSSQALSVVADDPQEHRKHLMDAQHKLEEAISRRDESLVLIACHELRESPLLLEMPSILAELQQIQFLASIHQLRVSTLVDINDFVKRHLNSIV